MGHLPCPLVSGPIGAFCLDELFVFSPLLVFPPMVGLIRACDWCTCDKRRCLQTWPNAWLNRGGKPQPDIIWCNRMLTSFRGLHSAGTLGGDALWCALAAGARAIRVGDMGCWIVCRWENVASWVACCAVLAIAVVGGNGQDVGPLGGAWRAFAERRCRWCWWSVRLRRRGG